MRAMKPSLVAGCMIASRPVCARNSIPPCSIPTLTAKKGECSNFEKVLVLPEFMLNKRFSGVFEWPPRLRATDTTNRLNEVV
jgi:hypothetical protein